MFNFPDTIFTRNRIAETQEGHFEFKQPKTNSVDFEELSYQFSKKYLRISPILLMRKFKLTYEYSRSLCYKVRMRQYWEAKEMLEEAEIRHLERGRFYDHSSWRDKRRVRKDHNSNKSNCNEVFAGT